jgi:hypothetical protein
VKKSWRDWNPRIVIFHLWRDPAESIGTNRWESMRLL